MCWFAFFFLETTNTEFEVPSNEKIKCLIANIIMQYVPLINTVAHTHMSYNMNLRCRHYVTQRNIRITISTTVQ